MADYIELPPWHTADWDTGYLDTVKVPGLVSVSVKRGPKWDRKPVKGQTGETQTFGGWNNAGLTIRIRTWTTAQHEEMLSTIVPIIEPTPGKDAPKEVAIEHPVATARKVETFKISDVDGPEANTKEGYVEWTIDAFQSLKKVPQQGGTGKPKTGGNGGTDECKRIAAEFTAAQQERAAIQNVLAIQANAGITSGPAYDNAVNALRKAEERCRYISTMFQSFGCNNGPPSAGAAGAAGGGPTP